MTSAQTKISRLRSESKDSFTQQKCIHSTLSYIPVQVFCWYLRFVITFRHEVTIAELSYATSIKPKLADGSASHCWTPGDVMSDCSRIVFRQLFESLLLLLGILSGDDQRVRVAHHYLQRHRAAVLSAIHSWNIVFHLQSGAFGPYLTDLSRLYWLLYVPTSPVHIYLICFFTWYYFTCTFPDDNNIPAVCSSWTWSLSLRTLCLWRKYHWPVILYVDGILVIDRHVWTQMISASVNVRSLSSVMFLSMFLINYCIQVPHTWLP